MSAQSTQAILSNKNYTGYHLKMIALITMLIDHVAAVFLWRSYVASFYAWSGMPVSLSEKWLYWIAENQAFVFELYSNMRIIGRMAFPIYCFLIIEGFLHTSNVKKYALRLGLFALISEIPFDLAITGNWWDNGQSNVFFTLVLGLLFVWGLSYVEKFYEFWQEKKWDSFMGRLVVGMLGIILAAVFGGIGEILLQCDYGAYGVLAIGIMYLFRKTKEIGFALGVVLLSLLSSNEIMALLMLFPIMKYNGERGKQTKYLFYGFYPVHLFLLGLLCLGLNI